MKLQKVLIINKAHLFNALNLAVGTKAMKVFNLQNEINAIIEPFYKFRTKLAEDMGITGDPSRDKKEDFEKYVEALTKYAEGDVELNNVNFLTDEEFSLAISPLVNVGSGMEFLREDMMLLKVILVEQDNKEE